MNTRAGMGASRRVFSTLVINECSVFNVPVTGRLICLRLRVGRFLSKKVVDVSTGIVWGQLIGKFLSDLPKSFQILTQTSQLTRNHSHPCQKLVPSIAHAAESLPIHTVEPSPVHTAESTTYAEATSKEIGRRDRLRDILKRKFIGECISV